MRLGDLSGSEWKYLVAGMRGEGGAVGCAFV